MIAGFKTGTSPELLKVPAYRYDLAAGALSGLFEGLTAPFLGVVARQLGAQLWQLALLASVPLIGHSISLYTLRWQRRFPSPLSFVAFVTGLSRILFLGMAWVTGPAPFIFCACLAQFFVPLHTPAYVEVIRRFYPESIRGKAMGSVRAVTAVATMLAAWLGGKFLDLVGFQAVFPLAAALGVLASWILARAPVSIRPARALMGRLGLFALPRLLRRHPDFARMEWAFFWFGFGHLMVLPLIPVLMVDHFRLSNFFVGQLAFAGALARLASLYAWGHAIDRFGSAATLRKIFLLSALIPFLFAVAPTAGFLFLPSILTGAVMVAGMELAVVGVVLQMTHGRDRSVWMAVHQTLVGVRAVSAPLLGTWLAHGLGIRPVFWVSTGVVLSGAALMRRLRV